ncbi:30S ribosomal protein S16 [Polynucleobacter sp. IMCC30063]|uniref:30S ribosomal protein S16 n=1 Tax=unclassified Polynucleobacter TaxID=2640945 RepID=UPI001F174301|nr:MULTISPECIES: 30S ribosomal protein S16 [unclassified Polynucleobacter]MCE7506378.1 30S ribosomal protein S16 [Polynucleobacter sp. IMCC30063]MCE7527650.1 30S ribosomal protein S16 [Polynucleobacter sp. IMCC 30228]MCE7529468.1 30S ribosomal protein S16 [Polynucleobacter sp. IMCC 29146]
MVVIRLARGGSKNRPFYSIVATDKRNRRDSNFIERLGYFNPNAVESEQAMRIAQERMTYWTTVGAQISPTVKRLIKDHPAAVV